MITWSIENLEYDDTDTRYPKRVDIIYVKATHPSGPTHYYGIRAPFPEEGEAFIPFENITEEWARNVLEKKLEADNGIATTAYLEELASSSTRGMRKPWEQGQ